MKKKVCIFAPELCIKRSLDSKRISTFLTQNNYEIVNNPKQSDTIIFMTCAVGNKKTDFSLDTVKELQKYDAELIVAGCLPDIEKEELSKIFNGTTISTKDIHKIDDIFQDTSIKFNTIDDANILFENFGFLSSNMLSVGIMKYYIKARNFILKYKLGETSTLYRSLIKKHFHIRISRGCLGKCSYCAIRKAVGIHKSKPFDICVQELRTGLNAGYKNFVIAADDIGAYGLDIDSSFPELLDKMTNIPDDFEIDLQEINPRWIVKYIDELEEIFKRGKIVQIDVALQSGSSRILQKMNRYFDTEKMKDAILRLRKVYPDLSITVQNIVGFPTETKEDFSKTIQFLKDIDFNGGLIYKFSCKTGTMAEGIEPKITKKEMGKRLKYAKKELKHIGCDVFYHSILSPVKFYNNLGYIKIKKKIFF